MWISFYIFIKKQQEIKMSPQEIDLTGRKDPQKSNYAEHFICTLGGLSSGSITLCFYFTHSI